MPGIADQLIANYANAWNAHDVGRDGASVPQDGTFVNVVGTYDKGREEIRHLHAAIHASFYKDSAIRSEVLDARELAPGVIVAHVANELEGDARAPGQTVRTLATYVIEQRAGSWKFTAGHNTRIVPAR
jgi:uncharacterized protein (TIGR02246 family)